MINGKMSPLWVHMMKRMILRTCVGMDASMKSEFETNLTFLKDITLNESPFENLEVSGPVSPLKDDIEDCFHIEKCKWEIVRKVIRYISRFPRASNVRA